MQGWLDEFEARGQAYAPRIRYQLAIAIGGVMLTIAALLRLLNRLNEPVRDRKIEAE